MNTKENSEIVCDPEVITQVETSPWEKISSENSEHIVAGGVADRCHFSSPEKIVNDFLGVPEFVDIEISEKFDFIQQDTTKRVVRVGTDLSWTLLERNN